LVVAISATLGAAGQQIGGGRLFAKARKRLLGDPQPTGNRSRCGFETIGLWCRRQCLARAARGQSFGKTGGGNRLIVGDRRLGLGRAPGEILDQLARPISQRSQPIELGPDLSPSSWRP
jgi:hypothetical protein